MTHATDIEQAIRTTIQRVSVATAMRGGAIGAIVGLGVAGVLVLALRLGFGLDWVSVLWALLAVPVGVIIGAVVSRKRLTEDEAAAWLDDRCSCGGLLMNRSAEWATLPSSVRVPRVCWCDRSLGIRLAVLAAFVIGAMAIPIEQTIAPSNRFNIESVVNKLEEQVELLEETQSVDAEEAQQIREELKSLGDSAKSTDPGRTWEALDHARQQLEQLAEQAAEDFADEARSAGAAEEFASRLADLIEQSPQGLTPEQTEALKQALESMSENPGSESLKEAMSNLSEALSQQGQQARQQQQQQAQQMAQTAAQCSGGACNNLGQLASGGMIDPSSLQQALAERAEAQDQLSELLSQLSSGESNGSELAAFLEGVGSGGVSRGPGAAKLSWNEMPSSIEGAEFDPVAVDSNGVDPTKSTLLSSGSMEPGDDLAGDASSGGAIDTSRSAETGSANPVVLPRHRDAVRRYFQRAPQKSAQPQPAQEPGE